ncbi:MAG: IPExxxVDY family protein [Prevotellaceae bacterium]|nr:IPExxxVDY family protein [Prevotellaceae bacterium]
MAKITKFKLEFEEDNRFSLVAISSCELPQRMAWLLNKTLHVDFENVTELQGKEVDGEKEQFPVFMSSSEFDDYALTLFTNKFNGQTLINSFPNIDYLLKISESLDDDTLRNSCASIRSIEGVTICTPVPDDKKIHPTLVDF